MVKFVVGGSFGGVGLAATRLLQNWKGLVVPVLFLLVNIGVATIGPWWTFFSLITTPCTFRAVRSLCKLKDVNYIYFCLTLVAMILFYQVFESVTHAYYGAITKTEYLISLILGGMTVFLIFLTKHFASITGGTGIHTYDYCKRCRKTYARRDHHCAWLDTCVAEGNKKTFITTLLFSLCWLFFTSMLNLTSICYPVYAFNGMKLNSSAGNHSANGRWFLIPKTCPDVYEKNQFKVTLLFVVSVYGFATGILLTCVLLHQIHQWCLGVTSLEKKYRSGNTGTNSEKLLKSKEAPKSTSSPTQSLSSSPLHPPSTSLLASGPSARPLPLPTFPTDGSGLENAFQSTFSDLNNSSSFVSSTSPP